MWRHYFYLVFLSCSVFGKKPDGERTVGSYKFEIYTSGKSLDAAISACKSRGAWLAEVKDKEINDVLMSMTSHDVLIGGKYDGVWKWNDGSEMIYKNWATNRPLSNAAYNCMLLEGNSKGTWKNVDCTSSPRRYICQSDITYPGNVQITVSKTKLTKINAKQACMNEAARLVEIKPWGLDSYISKNIGDDSWTGGVFDDTEWKWEDGTIIDQDDTRWGTNTPNVGRSGYCLMKSANGFWKSELCTTQAGYICQKDVTSGSCVYKACTNRGKCSILDQRYICLCDDGYFGTKCEKSIIEIRSPSNTFTVKKGKELEIMFTVVSYDGNVELKNVNGNKTLFFTSSITSSRVTEDEKITFGPFYSNKNSFTYTIKATSTTNNQNANITVVVNVQDHCESYPCQNGAECNYTTISPYFICTCTPSFYGYTCKERKFRENNNCKYHVNHDQLIEYGNAETICQNIGGSLAMLKSPCVQDLIEEQVVTQYGIGNTITELWIGGRFQSSTWIWLDNTSIPLVGCEAKWNSSNEVLSNTTTNSHLMLAAYNKNMLGYMKWFQVQSHQQHGYACEVAKTDPCSNIQCENEGICSSVGCQANCRCTPGYTGINCGKDIFKIAAPVHNYTSALGQNITVNLAIINYGSSVRIEVFENNTESDPIYTTSNTKNSVNIVIGPFNEQSFGTQYWFRATPQSNSDSFYKYTSIYVIVQAPAKILSITPKDFVLPSNYSAISCSATGVPLPAVFWYNNDRLVTSQKSENIHQVYNSGFAHLFVSNKSKTKFGLYTCHTYNVISGIKIIANDTAFLRGKIAIVSATISYSQIGTASLTCVYEGYPTPMVKWMREDISSQIVSNQIYSIKTFLKRTSGFSNTTTQLSIRLAEYFGQTKFVCAASNIYENITHDLEINTNNFVHLNRSFQYFNFGKTKSFKDALNYCISIHGNLATITDRITQNLLASAATKQKLSGRVYIGAEKHTEKSSKIWRWQDGTLLYDETKHNSWQEYSDAIVDGAYVAWLREKPGQDGACLSMVSSSWQWADGNCSSVLQFICDKKVSGIPTDFEILVYNCSSNATLKWSPANEAIGIPHRIVVKEMKTNSPSIISETVIPKIKDKIYEKNITNLKYSTSYNITITICPEMCPQPVIITETLTTQKDSYLCASLLCKNGGICNVIGCRELCQCKPGYYGSQCENDSIIISIRESNFTTRVGEWIAVTLDIRSENDLVRVDVFEETMRSRIVTTKNYVNESIVVAIGPFSKTTLKIDYYFRISPQSLPVSNNRWTFISVEVKERDNNASQQPQQIQIAIIAVSIYSSIVTVLIVIFAVKTWHQRISQTEETKNKKRSEEHELHAYKNEKFSNDVADTVYDVPHHYEDCSDDDKKQESPYDNLPDDGSTNSDYAKQELSKDAADNVYAVMHPYEDCSGDDKKQDSPYENLNDNDSTSSDYAKQEVSHYEDLN